MEKNTEVKKSVEHGVVVERSVVKGRRCSSSDCKGPIEKTRFSLEGSASKNSQTIHYCTKCGLVYYKLANGDVGLPIETRE